MGSGLSAAGVRKAMVAPRGNHGADPRVRKAEDVVRPYPCSNDATKRPERERTRRRMGASSSGPADDRDLMARLAQGDREALTPLVERHYTRLYRIALGYLRQRDDALDVVQEAFVKAFQAAGRWDGSADAGP